MLARFVSPPLHALSIAVLTLAGVDYVLELAKNGELLKWIKKVRTGFPSSLSTLTS